MAKAKARIRNYSGRNFQKTRVNDKLSQKARSLLMSRIVSKKTKFARDFIVLLKKSTKAKFQTHISNIKGKPDIVFAGEKICVFLDSDFWHGWQYPRWQYLLKNDFWRQKIIKNRKRDVNVSNYLKKKGWKVIRVWEHKIKNDSDSVILKIINFLGSTE